jgi:hypothetical protein
MVEGAEKIDEYCMAPKYRCHTKSSNETNHIRARFWPSFYLALDFPHYTH